MCTASDARVYPVSSPSSHYWRRASAAAAAPEIHEDRGLGEGTSRDNLTVVDIAPFNRRKHASRNHLIKAKKDVEREESYASTFIHNVYSLLRITGKSSSPKIACRTARSTDNGIYVVPKGDDSTSPLIKTDTVVVARPECLSDAPVYSDDIEFAYAPSSQLLAPKPTVLADDPDTGGQALFFHFERPLTRWNLPSLKPSVRMTKGFERPLITPGSTSSTATTPVSFSIPEETLIDPEGSSILPPFEEISGSPYHTLLHQLDTHHLRPDFIHATASGNLVGLVERKERHNLRVFNLHTNAWFTLPPLPPSSSPLSLTNAAFLADSTLVVWRKMEAKLTFIRSPNAYFTDIRLQSGSMPIEVAWLKHNARFVWFGGRGRSSIGKAGAPPLSSRSAPFAIYRIAFDLDEDDCPAEIVEKVWESSESTSSPLTKWSACLTWLDESAGIRKEIIRFVAPALVREEERQMGGKLRLQTFDVKTGHLSEVETRGYAGPIAFFRRELALCEGVNEEFTQLHGWRRMIVRVPQLLSGGLTLLDLDSMVVRRIELLHSWLPPDMPSFINTHAVTRDGRVLLFLSTEQGGLGVRKRALHTPDVISADHVAAVYLSASPSPLPLAELVRLRALSLIQRRERFEMLKRSTENADDIIRHLGRKPLEKWEPRYKKRL